MTNATNAPILHTAHFNCRFTLSLPEEVVRACYHSGDCLPDCENNILLPEVKAEMDKIDPEALRIELREYGAWSEDELSNHNDNLIRLLWIASGNIQDEWEESAHMELVHH